MIKKNKINKQDIIDWFIIQRIRFLNFVREHKYLSVGIGVFLLSSIVYLIAFASESDPYENKVSARLSNVTTKNVTSSETIEEIDSFSTLVYDFSYQLSAENLPEEGLVRNYVELVAEFNSGIDAEWIVYSNETTETNISEDGRKLTMKIYSVKVGELNTKQLYLKVNNVKGDNSLDTKEIQTTINIKEFTMSEDSTTATSDSILVGTSVKETKEVGLTYELVGGTAYNSEFCESGRCAPFGIILGINESELINNGLSGLYFNPEISMVLEAEDNENKLELLTDSKQYGLFTSAQEEILRNMPKLNYNSAIVELDNSVDYDSSQNDNEVSTPRVSLIGPTTVNLKKGEEYSELGYIDSANFCTASGSVCEIVIKKDGETVDEVSTEEAGEYKIYYTFSNLNSSVIFERLVNVLDEEKEIIEIDDVDKYTLNGNSEIIVPFGKTYDLENSGENTIKDAGIKWLTDELPSFEYTSYITKYNGNPLGESVTSIFDEGVYEITYEIFEPQYEDGESVGTLTRTVKIVKNTDAKVLKADKAYKAADGTNLDLKAKLDGEDCNNCEISYYSMNDNELESIDTSVPGKYKVKYLYTEEDKYSLEVINELELPALYKLSIKNLKISDVITKHQGMVVFGAYYVNANSIRTEENEEDIEVTLTSGTKTATVTNPFYSAGTKNNNLSFYNDETGELKSLSTTDALAYGENIILRSQFEYLSDGDNDLNQLSNKLDFSTAHFSKMSYDAETSLEYYLKIDGKRIVSVNEDGTLKYYDGDDTDGNPIYKDFENIKFNITIDAPDSKLNYVEYTIDELEPGTKIDFRLRLKVGSDNPVGEEIEVSSEVNYTQNDEAVELPQKSTSIIITPFKARTEVFINNNNYDVIINGAAQEDQVSTWAIYPTINLPAEDINTNILGIDYIDSAVITITLPKEINYIYNENYILPDNVNNITNSNAPLTLVYTLKGLQINDWIEPIMFETNYDVDIPSGSELNVSVTIDATTPSGMKDVSDSEHRTTNRKITYQNNEEVATSIYTSYVAIPKDTQFDINTKLYNNSLKNFENLQVVTVLPYNEIGSGSNFTGFYKLEDISSNTLCTMEENISEEDFVNESIWELCSLYEEEDYEGVTAIKFIGINLNENNKYFDNSFNIIPYDNSTDDNYVVKSYLIMNTDIKKLSELNISVISKKITGTVWEDFDGNGIMTGDEKKVPDITMKLYDAETDELVTTVVTDSTGKYSLSDIEVGSYYVVAEYNTSKYGFTTPFVGNNKSIYSSFDSVEVSDVSKYSSALLVGISEDEGNDDSEEDGNSAEDSDGIEGEDSGESGDDDLGDEPEDSGEPGDDDLGDEPEDNDDLENEEETIIPAVLRTNVIEITDKTKIVSNINLGLTLKKVYSVRVSKYITKAYITNSLGATDVKDFGKATLAKLDVKDINKLNLKIVYTIELENIGYYPGYVYRIKDYIPDGMKFNESYEENKGWVLTDDGYVENNTLFDDLLFEGDKRHLTLAFDIDRKEAGSFINYARVEDDDLQMLVIDNAIGDGGE